MSSNWEPWVRKPKALADNARVPWSTWFLAGGKGPAPTAGQLRDRRNKLEESGWDGHMWQGHVREYMPGFKQFKEEHAQGAYKPKSGEASRSVHVSVSGGEGSNSGNNDVRAYSNSSVPHYPPSSGYQQSYPSTDSDEGDAGHDELTEYSSNSPSAGHREGCCIPVSDEEFWGFMSSSPDSRSISPPIHGSDSTASERESAAEAEGWHDDVRSRRRPRYEEVSEEEFMRQWYADELSRAGYGSHSRASSHDDVREYRNSSVPQYSPSSHPMSSANGSSRPRSSAPSSLSSRSSSTLRPGSGAVSSRSSRSSDMGSSGLMRPGSGAVSRINSDSGYGSRSMGGSSMGGSSRCPPPSAAASSRSAVYGSSSRSAVSSIGPPSSMGSCSSLGRPRSMGSRSSMGSSSFMSSRSLGSLDPPRGIEGTHGLPGQLLRSKACAKCNAVHFGTG